MGTYNTLHLTLPCRRCDVVVEAEVDCHFGDASFMSALKMGDRYPWRPGRAPQNGGRPEGGHAEGEGYMVCPGCGKDSHLLVVVQGDLIVAIKPHPDKVPYIPD